MLSSAVGKLVVNCRGVVMIVDSLPEGAELVSQPALLPFNFFLYVQIESAIYLMEDQEMLNGFCVYCKKPKFWYRKEREL